jgi:hypothetical protein
VNANAMLARPLWSSPAIRARRGQAIVDEELGAGDAVHLRSADEGGRPAVRRGQVRFSPTLPPWSGAPSLIPKRPGDLVKPDRPDAPGLLRILIGGFPSGRSIIRCDLTSITLNERVQN